MKQLKYVWWWALLENHSKNITVFSLLPSLVLFVIILPVNTIIITLSYQNVFIFLHFDKNTFGLIKNVKSGCIIAALESHFKYCYKHFRKGSEKKPTAH